MGTYTDIIERLEKATGPSAPLTASALEATGLYVRERRGRDRKDWLYPTFKNYGRVDPECPAGDHVTASLDASIALVERMLPGWFWRVGRTPLYENGWAHVSKYHADHCDRKDEASCADGKAANPPIAILIAMFRALEHQEANHAD